MNEENIYGQGSYNQDNLNDNFPSESNSEIYPKKHSNATAKIVLGIIILAVIGGAVFGAYYLWNYFGLSPDKVVEKMIDKMGDIKTFHSNFKAKIETIGNQTSQTQITLDSDSDFTDSKNPKTSSNFDFQANGEKEKGNLALSGEFRSEKNVSYFKLNKISISPSLEFYLMMLGIKKDSLIGKWLKIDKNELEKLNGKTEQPKPSSKDVVEMNKEIGDLIKREKVYTIKKMSDETINGKNAYHYVLILNKEKIKKMIPDFLDIVKKYSKNNLDRLNMIDAKEVEQSIDKFFEKVNGLSIDIWIGKKDYLLYKAKIDKEINASAIKEGATGKIIITLDLLLSNFDKPIKIEMPKNSLDLKDIQSLLGSNPYLNEARNKAKDIAIKTGLSGLRSMAELYWMNNKESYKGFCASSRVANVKKEIAENGKYMICNDSSASWAACSSVYSKSERYWCVDSKGNMKMEPNMNCSKTGFTATVCP